MKKNYISIIALIICSVIISTELRGPATAQELPAAGLSINSEKNDDASRSRVFWGTMVGIPLATLLYGNEFWEWGSTQRWRWANEGFFGEHTDSGGTDKMGHCFTHYIITRSLYNIFDYTEQGSDMKWFYSLGMAAGFGLIIEIGDAYTGHYGFSFEDLLADFTGIAMGALMEKYPHLDEYIGFSWEYIPTRGFLDENNGYPERFHFTSDYSGHKYMINFKLAGIYYSTHAIPEFCRYLMLDLGYHTNGYTEFDGSDEEKKRSIYVGISVNFVEVVRDFFVNNPQSRAKTVLEQPFKYYHVPVHKNKDMDL